MAEAGKGDTPRPIVDRKQFEANWDTIFGKKCSKGLCENRKQCWEPCGDLGKDEKYTIPLTRSNMKKEVKAIMALVEAYRTSGGREEHFARREILENALEELVPTADELRNFYDLGYDVGAAKLKESREIDAANIELWKDRLAESWAENTALRNANLYCVDMFNQLMEDYNKLKQGKHAN